MNKPLSLLIALVFALVTIGPAAAMPKVPEDEFAPVTSGADAPKPKKTKVGNANPVEKKKAGKSARHARAKHKAIHGKTRHR